MTQLTYHDYRLHLYVQNDIGVMVRINVVLRKFAVNIQSIDVSVAEGTSKFSHIIMDVETAKDETHMEVVRRKLERLIPVLWVTCKKTTDIKKEGKGKAERFDF